MTVVTDLDPAVAYPATTPEMGEGWLHYYVRVQTFSALRDHFAGRPDCFVASDFNVYYRPRPEPEFVAPDLFVCFGVDAAYWESQASYRIWDAGAPPRFVLEVASRWTHRRDREEKPAIYLEVGAEEFWRFDATGGEFHTPILQGDRRAGGAWAPIEVSVDAAGGLCGRSDALGLDLCAEPRRLRFRDPDTGGWLPDHDDTRIERDAEAAARRAAEAELAALRARLEDRDDDAGADRRDNGAQ